MKTHLLTLLISIIYNLNLDSQIADLPIATDSKPFSNKEIIGLSHLFDADWLLTNSVFAVLNGPRTGELFYTVESCTYVPDDSRRTNSQYIEEWTFVQLKNKKVSAREQWIRIDELSYSPSTVPKEIMELCKVRIFEVSDNTSFIKLQSQLIKTLTLLQNGRPRILYKNQLDNNSGHNWAAVSHYQSWENYDHDLDSAFVQTFIKEFGEEAYYKYQLEWDKTVISSKDEWRQLLPDLSKNVKDQ